MSYIIRLITQVNEIEQAFEVRRQVFIKEQQVPEEIELDEYDHLDTTQHLIALDKLGRGVGTARFRPYGDLVLKVERVAVLAELRGTGLGRQLMEKIEDEAKKRGYQTIKLNAQVSALSFYEKLDYQSVGKVFLEADIEHISMKKSLI